MNKFNNRKVVYDNIEFDSMRERDRYIILRGLEKSGKIRDLRLQVPFELIPKQKLPEPVMRRGCKHRELTLRSVTYIADFVYEKDGKVIVEDVKGMRTAVYVIKRALMLYRYGIQVIET